MEGASAMDLQSRMGITMTCSSRADRSPPLTLTSWTHCLERHCEGETAVCVTGDEQGGAA